MVHRNNELIIYNIKSARGLLLEAGLSFERGQLSTAKNKLNEAKDLCEVVIKQL